MDLPYDALPGLYHGADSSSTGAQRRYLVASRLRLILLIAAAVTGAVSVRLGNNGDFAGVGTAIALVGAIVAEGWLVKERPERSWYDGRALAESAKTLAWRFAVCAPPFPRSLDNVEAERRFVDQLAQLLEDAPSSAIDVGNDPALNDTLRQIRRGTLEERKAVYLRDRIAEQRDWYSNKSQRNRKSALGWQVALVTIEATGVLCAILRAMEVIDVDLAGIVAAMAGAGVAWLSIRQHALLGRTYGRTASLLAIVHDRLSLVRTEERWAVEVADAEEVISREHVMWRASRSH
jgi:hypothetical protein